MNRSNHALRRARERYGVKITARDLDAISATIAAGDAHLLQRRGRTTVYAVNHSGTLFIAAYRRTEKRVLTFLPYAKHMDDIVRLGLLFKVTIYLRCRGCETDVSYAVRGSVSANGTTRTFRRGQKAGECFLCGNALVVQGVKKSLTEDK